jgi:hypothetical protein
MKLYEILVPTVRNDGQPFRLRHHRVWDAKVRGIAGGLTVLTPAKGQWVAPCGTVFAERMIPVRIACSHDQIERIADYTAKHYGQQAVMYWKVSDEVVVRHYPAKVVDKLFSQASM